MKITAVKSFAPTLTERSVFVVKVETDAGISGYGEAGTVSRERALGGMIEHFAQFLVGMDPRRIENIWQALYRCQYFEGGTVMAAAVSAIDIALWDILAKSLGVPVYQLLGGKSREFVTCFADAGSLVGETCVEAARGLVADGWRTIRFVPGMAGATWTQTCEEPYEPRESLRLAVHWLQRVRDSLGPEIDLAIDIHHRFSVAEAARFCQQVEPLNMRFVEEPIRCENPQAYATLRTMTRVPFAIGEEFSSKWAFLPYIEQGLTKFARVDVCNVGGFTEAKKVAGWCEAHYIDMMPHNPLGPISTAACVHFCTAIHNFAALEHNRVFEGYPRELFPGGPSMDGDKFTITETPGLGIELNEEALADYPFRDYECPHWNRRDGSYTNW